MSARARTANHRRLQHFTTAVGDFSAAFPVIDLDCKRTDWPSALERPVQPPPNGLFYSFELVNVHTGQPFRLQMSQLRGGDVGMVQLQLQG